MKSRTVIFRTTDQLIKDIEEFIKESGHYRNKTEVINEALRNFVKINRQTDTNNNVRRRK